jgi:O-antigen chain-terminating methyltransferase
MERDVRPLAAEDDIRDVNGDPEADLTLRALAAASTPSLAAEVAAAANGVTPESEAPDAGALAQMRETADLFGFAITSNRSILGLPHVKRALRRLQYQVFARQSDFNRATTHVLGQLAAVARRTEAERRIALRALTAVEHRLHGLERQLQTVTRDNARLSTELAQQRLERPHGSEPEVEELQYVGLQGRFRGSLEEIAERQRRYLEIFAENGAVLDIGCGRGEFLGLLRESGREATGVDTEPDMVALCRADGFDVAHDDGIRHLRGLDDGSVDGVFAAQVIEHLPPAQVAALVQTARRKLRPGGALVLETVNPTSLVALMNFYLDFTHVAPIHPLALEWLAQSSGFESTEILYLSPVEGGMRLQPLPGPLGDERSRRRFDDAIEATNEILYGPRDYALVARKS